jgi:hypothetical protein
MVSNSKPSDHQVDNTVLVQQGDQLLEIRLDIHSFQPSITIPEHPERGQTVGGALGHPKLQVVSLGVQIHLFDVPAQHD